MTVKKINEYHVYDVQLQTSFLILSVVLASLQREKDGSSYIPADSTFSLTRILQIIVATFGSIRVIRFSGTVIVSVIMAMGTIFHHLVRNEVFY